MIIEAGPIIFYSLLIIGIEALQCLFGQSMDLFFLHSGFLISLLIITNRGYFRHSYYLLMILYEIIEAASWITIQSNITFQVLNAIDFSYASKSHPEFYLYFFPGVLVVLLLVFFPVPYKKQIMFNWPKALFVYGISIALSYKFTKVLYNSLYPFNSDVLVSLSNLGSDLEPIAKFLTSPAHKTSSNKTRNLILFTVESLEYQSLGINNKHFPRMMPYLSNLSQQGYMVPDVQSQPYTTWTAASVFLQNCGFPHIISDIQWKSMRTTPITQWPKMMCVPDMLRQMGYDLLSFAVADIKMMGIKDFLKIHHFAIKDSVEHGFDHDIDLFNYLGDKILPELAKKTDKPYFLYIFNEDTHPMFYVDQRCKDKGEDSWPQIVKSFHCYDQIFEKLMKRIIELKLHETSEIVILGDHLVVGNQNGVYDEPRKLAVLFPFKEKPSFKKVSTMYNVAPTLMELANVQYSPPFPFGASFFSSEEGKYPGNKEFTFLYDFFSKQMHISEKVKCGDKEGFCTGDEYYKSRLNY